MGSKKSTLVYDAGKCTDSFANFKTCVCNINEITGYTSSKANLIGVCSFTEYLSTSFPLSTRKNRAAQVGSPRRGW